MPGTHPNLTLLLADWSKGEKAAFDQLVPLVEAELRRIARRALARQRRDHTLQTSALINEAYLRMVGQRSISWQNRAHFFAVASQVMRHILVDHARRYRAAKHGGGAVRVSWSAAEPLAAQRADEIVALDEALRELAVHDERKSAIVELRYFGGLTVDETAEVLGVAPITVMREWRATKMWLHAALRGGEHDPGQE
jgi:RNA polymerase sigma-70 factor (ECF subfamily)